MGQVLTCRSPRGDPGCLAGHHSETFQTQEQAEGSATHVTKASGKQKPLISSLSLSIKPREDAGRGVWGGGWGWARSPQPLGGRRRALLSWLRFPKNRCRPRPHSPATCRKKCTGPRPTGAQGALNGGWLGRQQGEGTVGSPSAHPLGDHSALDPRLELPPFPQIKVPTPQPLRLCHS